MENAPEPGKVGEVIWRRGPFTVEVAAEGDVARWFFIVDQYNGTHLVIMEQGYRAEDIPRLLASDPVIWDIPGIPLPHLAGEGTSRPLEYARYIAAIYANIFEQMWRRF
ncbi:MAG TPA: hypothetical protein VGB66_17985 [Longimicrobium sp.]|jgi:hypothetical protein